MKNFKYILCLSALFFLSSTGFSQSKKYAIVEIKTEYGSIILKLYDETPLHRDNFLKLTADTFFNGILFHRVIKNFVVQGGDPDSRNAKPDIELGNGGPAMKFLPNLILPYIIKEVPWELHVKATLLIPKKNPQVHSFILWSEKYLLMQNSIRSRKNTTKNLPHNSVKYTKLSVELPIWMEGTLFSEK